MNIDNSSEWEYRVVRQTTEDGDEWLSVQEVYYDDETKEPMAHTMDLQVDGDNIADLRKILQSMLLCIDKDAVTEIESDVATDNMEDRVLSLETENAKMRDGLKELGESLGYEHSEMKERLRKLDLKVDEVEEMASEAR